jgi:phosphatidylglycerol:prolipoprotein diacylglycerol transferase
MLYHTLSPFLWHISGDFGIRWYSLAYIAGFIITFFVLRHFADKKLIKGLTRENLDTLIIYLILGVIIGARFFHVFVYEPAYYFANPADMIKIWQGGLSFHGGLVGVALALWLFTRKYKVKFFELADIIVIPLGIFLMLGRIANFINGELYGTVTNVSWCVDYSKNQYIYSPPEGCRHPTQLYEAGKNLFMAAVLFLLYRRDKKLKKKRIGTGFYSFLFLIMYGTLRFFITFYRDEPAVLGTGISEAQWLCVAMIAIGTFFLLRMRRKLIVRSI